MMIRKIIPLFCLLILSASIAIAQSYTTTPETAEAAIRQLDDGMLIVRLPSHHKKITEMKRLLEEGNLSGSTAHSLKKRLQETIEERDYLNRLWVEEFKKTYTFSDILFTYDTTITAIHSNNGKYSFLDETLEIDSSLVLGDQPFLLARFGTTDSNTTTGLDALIIQDNRFNDLSRPFPYYVRLNKFMYVFNKIFSPDIAEPRKVEAVVRELQEKLKDYAEEVD